jgi:single-stranded DNA-binding protein
MANKKINNINIDGLIGKDPTIKQVGSYTIAEFDICHNNSKKVNGQWENEPMWIGATYFLHDSDDRRKFAKGALVELTGSLKCDSWTSGDGQKRTKFKVAVGELIFIDSANQSTGYPNANHEDKFEDDEFEDSDDSSIPF